MRLGAERIEASLLMLLISGAGGCLNTRHEERVATLHLSSQAGRGLAGAGRLRFISKASGIAASVIHIIMRKSSI